MTTNSHNLMENQFYYLAVVDKPIPRTITLLNSNLASYNQDDPSNMGYAWSMDGQVLRN